MQKALDKQRDTRRTGPHPLLPADVTPVGRSMAMRNLRQDAATYAGRGEPLLIVGETGSGRSLTARHVHMSGSRADRPFITLAAAAIPETNVAQALFGIGPDAEGVQEAGYLERAGDGTLFIQDLHSLCDAGQRLLAGALEQGSFVRLGHAEPVSLDARIITSLTPDAGGRVRPDLLARLAVLEIRVPPLRDRPEDVTELLRYCVDRLVDDEALPFRRFSVAAQNRLRHYPWPGNVRELESLIRKLLVAGGPEEIGLAELEDALEPPAGAREPLVKQDLLSLPLREAREQFERAYLVEQLALCGGRVGALAKRVGMERTHLYRKLRSLGVDFRQIGDED